MEAAALRSKLHPYLDRADERILRIFHAIMEAEEKNSPTPGRHSAPNIIQEHKTYDEKAQEEGMGKPKDDHRLK